MQHTPAPRPGRRTSDIVLGAPPCPWSGAPSLSLFLSVSPLSLSNGVPPRTLCINVLQIYLTYSKPHHALPSPHRSGCVAASRAGHVGGSGASTWPRITLGRTAAEARQNGGRSAAEAVTSFIVSVRRDGRSFLRRRRLPGADRRRRGRLVPISRALPTAPHERPHALASVACGGPHRTRWDRATMASIKSVHARAIFDSRGNPTVEVDVTTDLGTRCARRRSRRAGSCSGSGCRARAVHRR